MSDRFPISDTVIQAPASGSQMDPSAARSGSNTLVVWRDAGADSTIVGTRLNSSGEILDPYGLQLSDIDRGCFSPRVAGNGTDWLVAWMSSAGSGSLDDEIWVRPVDIDGSPTNSSTMIDTHLQLLERSILQDVVYGDGIYVILWSIIPAPFSGPRHIYATRVDSLGHILDPTPIPIGSETASATSPSAAYDGQDFLIVWTDYRNGLTDIYACRLSTAGQLLDGEGFLVFDGTTRQSNPTVVNAGDHYFVAWLDEGDANIYGTRVESTGNVIDLPPIAVSSNGTSTNGLQSAFDGTHTLIAWRDTRNEAENSTDIYGTTVDSSGVVGNSAGQAIVTHSSEQHLGDISNLGSGFLVLWYDERNNSDDVYAQQTDTLGNLDGNDYCLKVSGNSQEAPRVSYGSSSWLVVWSDRRLDGLPQIYAARISETGTILDADGFDVALSPQAQYEPAVDFQWSKLARRLEGGSGNRIDKLQYTGVRALGRTEVYTILKESTSRRMLW